MKRNGLFSLVSLTVILTALLAAPSGAQEQVFGVFEGQQVDGQQGTGNSGTGAMVLRGWALAGSGVRQVIIQVDGQDAGMALLGRTRPGVERSFPGYPDSSAAGWGFRLNTTRYSNGFHEVSAIAVSNEGRRVKLETLDGDDSYRFQFTNNTHLLTPFGRINFPQRNAFVTGTCDLTSTLRRLTPVTGWALDLGVETNDAGIGWVELMVDNQPVANTRSGCSFSLGAGGFTDCYGLPRPEIERLYPFAKDAPNAGFRFVLDIGFMVSGLLYTEGSHLLTIRAGDTSNQLADIDEFPVFFICDDDVPNEPAFGFIESPRRGAQYGDDIVVQGWLLDREGVDRVTIFVDGEPVGTADYGADDGIFETRPGVFSQYFGFPDAEAPVFRLRGGFDTTELSDGGHQLQVRVLDLEGERSWIGEVTFFVDNRNND